MKAKSSFHLITGSVLALLILTFSISAQTYQLSGRVYEGTTGQEPPNSSYLSGVTVKLWASDNSGQKETLVESTTTNSEGWYGLSVDVGDYPRDYFIIEEIDPDDYTSDGATSMGGSVLSSNIIQYTYGELSGTVTGNKFWDKPDTPDNEDPVADAGGPYSGTVGQSITLDGSGSSDPDGTINTYEWDLNGDGDYNDAGDKTGQTVQNTWSSAGTYTVNLRVTDNDGAKDSDAASVKISGTEGDTDGDGIPDNVEGTGDRDGDDIPDNEDYDPNGWIYDEITGAIIKGGAITVTPSKGVNIIEDGSLGFYKFTVSKDGQYTLDYTPPAGYKSSLTHVAMAGQLDPDPATDPDPLVVGAGSRNDITNQLTDWSAANNPYYLQFKLSLGDPTIINNNIPLEGQHFDYGDAPLPYPSASHRIDTTAASDMPWFTESDVTLIGQPDAETDMQREPPGLGDNYNGTDDEQGMVVYGDLDVGSVYMDHFMYSGNGSYTCEAWIDLNGDGDWDDPGEKIAKMGGGATSISGLYRMRWYVLVPDTAKAGKTYIRFRVVEGSGVTLTPDGPADFGEVEDYEVEILPEPYDYGDAPLPYPSASHKIDTTSTEGPWLYLYSVAPPLSGLSKPDPDPGMQRTPPGLGDDNDGKDDEESIYILRGDWTQGTSVQAGFQAYSSTEYTVKAWIDFNGDGDWDDANEEITLIEIMKDEWGLDINVPIDAHVGKTYMRCRIVKGKDVALTPDGPADYGEVEDYEVEIKGIDYGDAPASYDSASHEIDMQYYMGSLVDGEVGPKYSSDATGDDLDNLDDEDGVTFISDFVPGQKALTHIEVTAPVGDQYHVALWIDYNQDGVFDDITECVTKPTIASSTGNSVGIKFQVPGGAVLGKTFARFRLYKYYPTLLPAPTGLAEKGEVEDYQVEIKTEGTQIPDGGVIIGIKWNDLNSNGKRDSGEPGLANWQIYLDLDANGAKDAADPVTTTDSNGHYLFPGLAAGTYIVTEVQEAGWTQTCPSGSGTYTVTVDPTNAVISSYDFGNTEDSNAGLSAVKWYQPPLTHFVPGSDSTCFQGWHEISTSMMPMLADDWFCYNPQPVMEVRWWGAYADWDSTTVPSEAPEQFLLSIWTDVPFETDRVYSHPGDMIHQWMVDRSDLGEKAVRAVQFPEIQESLITGFEYTYTVPSSDWFYQEGDSTVYWLSIAAIYVEDQPPGEHLWGWLTREHYFHGDAVHMNFETVPEPGSTFADGEPFNARWDMAFILATEEMESAFDFGDAPQTDYATSKIKNGAQHLIHPDIYLGENIDKEDDGLPQWDALGDDQNVLDDEDGVEFTESISAGEENELAVQVSSHGYLNLWLDVFGNGNWYDPEDHVLEDVEVLPGEHILPFFVTEEAAEGETVARVRFSREKRLWFNGFAMDGEVEDYVVTIKTVTDVEKTETIIPTEFKLYCNYPNPFNPVTHIRFLLPENGNVRLNVYNMQGMLVKTLTECRWQAGSHELIWDATDNNGTPMSTGLYLCRIQTDKYQKTIRMLLVK